MGGLNSKLCVQVSTPTSIFPSFENEEELLRKQEEISEAHAHAIDIAKWIAQRIVPPEGYIFVTAVSSLIRFLLVNFRIKEIGSIENAAAHRMNNAQNSFIDAKINKVVANATSAGIHAKIMAIGNRYTRLLSEIPIEDRRLEVVPALQTCEEILELFRNQDHVLWNNPSVSAPLLVSFGAVYTAVAELSLALVPSYSQHLTKQINLLQEIVVKYRDKCLTERTSALRINELSWDSIVDCAGNFGKRSSIRMFKLEDPYEPIFQDGLQLRNYACYDSLATAQQVYTSKLEKRYKSFFDSLLNSTKKFSGFQD